MYGYQTSLMRWYNATRLCIRRYERMNELFWADVKPGLAFINTFLIFPPPNCHLLSCSILKLHLPAGWSFISLEGNPLAYLTSTTRLPWCVLNHIQNLRGTLSCPTLRAGSWPNILGLESGRHFFSERWKLADIFFRGISCRHFFSRNGQLQILFFCQQNL